MATGYALLDQAISNRQDILLSLGADCPERVVARFDAELDEPDHGIRALIIEGAAPVVDPFVLQGRPLEVSFNTASARVFFDSVPLRRGRHWFKQWIVLKWPDQLTVLERRDGSRQPVPDDLPLVAVLSGPSGGASLRAQLWDISLTGAAFLCPVHAELPEPVVGEAFTVLLTFQECEFRFNARCRHVQRLSSTSLRAGMEFQAEQELDPPSLASFNRMLQDLKAFGIRRTFRSTLTKTGIFTNA